MTPRLIRGPAHAVRTRVFDGARWDGYRPRPDDIVISTYPKCGTTWMQNIVYEVLHQGAGTLVESGATMYSISPWLEGLKSVPLEKPR